MALTFKKISRAGAKKLKAGEILREHGIEYSRLKNGDGRYSINISVDGQRIHKVVGNESDGVTRSQAKDYIEKVKTDAREGRLNLPKGRKEVSYKV